jgi:hypothetical protein
MRHLDMLHSRALKKELERELREMPSLSRYKLHRRSRRQKALMRTALAARRRYEYAARKALCRMYAREIARKMRQV